MERNILKNLSSLTQVDINTLNKLSTLAEDCICDYVLEGIETDDDVVIVDIGVGLLHISIIGDELEYKFTPSRKLEGKLKKTVYSEISPLVVKLEYSLDKKFTAAYKELL